MTEISNRHKVVIVDSSPIIMEGITTILKGGDEFDVIAQIDSFRRLLERLPYLRPDILIINPLLIDYSKRLLVGTLFSDYPDITLVALHYAYIEQQVLRQYHAILEIDDNRQRMEAKLKESVTNNKEEVENNDSFDLTSREKDVLVSVSKGMINKEIARELNISIHTVISHRKNIIRKTGIKSVAGLTVYALLNNLIDEKDVQ